MHYFDFNHYLKHWVVLMEWRIFLQVTKYNLTYFSSKVLYILLFSNGKKC